MIFPATYSAHKSQINRSTRLTFAFLPRKVKWGWSLGRAGAKDIPLVLLTIYIPSTVGRARSDPIKVSKVTYLMTPASGTKMP